MDQATGGPSSEVKALIERAERGLGI
jgi:hypothetical protein